MRREMSLPFFALAASGARTLARAARGAVSPPQPTHGAVDTGLRVGVAQVRQVTAEGLPVVRLDDAWGSSLVAEWALPYRYEPQVGDLLRVISLGQRAYVLGVHTGRGRTRLAFRGDVRIGARGTLRLVAHELIRLRSANLSLRAKQALTVTAIEVQEKLGEAVRATKGLLEQRARDWSRVTEGEESVVAREVQVIAATKAVIDGERIEVS